MAKIKRLYRSGTDKVVAGVCSGVAEYLNVDPVPVRLIWIIASLFPPLFGSGLLAYLIAWLVIPKNPKHKW